MRFAARPLTLSVRSFQVPETPFTLGLAAQLAFGTDLVRHARDLGGERVELVHHRVDDLGRAQELALQRATVDSSYMVWVRSPFATAPITRATSVVGCTRSP